MTAVLSLRFEARQTLDDLRLLTESARRSPRLRARLLDQVAAEMADTGSLLGCTALPPSTPDGPADQIAIRLQLSGRLAALVREVRAGAFDAP